MKNNLRELRTEREWSQAQLAERLDVSRQTVNALETGKYDPSLPLAFKIAALFERYIEDIFTPDEREGPAAGPSGTGNRSDIAGRSGTLRRRSAS